MGEAQRTRCTERSLRRKAPVRRGDPERSLLVLAGIPRNASTLGRAYTRVAKARLPREQSRKMASIMGRVTFLIASSSWAWSITDSKAFVGRSKRRPGRERRGGGRGAGREALRGTREASKIGLFLRPRADRGPEVRGRSRLGLLYAASAPLRIRSARLAQNGGPRAGARAGATVASPMAWSVRLMSCASRTRASTRIRPAHFGHARPSMPSVPSSSAQERYRQGDAVGVRSKPRN